MWTKTNFLYYYSYNLLYVGTYTYNNDDNYFVKIECICTVSIEKITMSTIDTV